MPKKWKPVVGYEGRYEVSDQGGVRGLDRMVRGKIGMRKHVGRLIAVHLNPCGYPTVRLHKDGVGASFGVHRLVATAFLCNPPTGLEVNHKDSNPANNTPANLEWVTHGENLRHAYKNGRLKPPVRRGESHYLARLNNQAVIEIRKRVHAGESQRAVARSLGIAPSMVWNIINGRAWAHVAAGEKP